MLLKTWRENNGWTLARLAEELDLPGAFPVGTVQRWESGKSRPEADIIAKIEKVTGGKVTASDMHETRLAWLTREEASAA